MPQMLPPSLSALAARGNNANLLQGMDSDVNVGGGYGDVFAGPAAGHVPTAWEQFSGDRNADAAETAMGAGPAIDALRKMSRAQEAQKLENNSMDEADFFAHGLDRGLTHANTQNQVADVLNEGAARRHFLPFEKQFEEGNDEQAQSLAATRYMLPAQIEAQSRLGAASMEAQGRVGAAQAGHPTLSPLQAMQDALMKRFAAGYAVSPKELEQLQQVKAAIEAQQQPVR